ncbi:hypothetical protein [Nocardia wallacei]|uniref:hypothetical protein n=1 Tax=Nocardia wallacei TaxID=480035 RepID=UPI002453F85A|nr:hypothetical protein [Nocardia wallacei]
MAAEGCAVHRRAAIGGGAVRVLGTAQTAERTAGAVAERGQQRAVVEVGKMNADHNGTPETFAAYAT